MQKRTCTTPGCGKARRAKGLCSTCYNQRTYTPAQRHMARLVECAVCKTEVARPAHADRRFVCSVACRTILQHGADDHVGIYDWATDAAKRARTAGAMVIELFDRTDVFERDNWTCGICTLPVVRDASPFDPMSATVDHVVPLSRGGEHTLANAQCAHLGCNSSKRDASLGDSA